VGLAVPWSGGQAERGSPAWRGVTPISELLGARLTQGWGQTPRHFPLHLQKLQSSREEPVHEQLISGVEDCC